MADITMNDVAVLQIEIPNDMLQELKNISEDFGTDLNTDMVNLFECYIQSFCRLHSVPAESISLGGGISWIRF